MNEKILNVTLISRHDIEANWLQSDYVPEKGEIIVYDIESGEDLFPENRYQPYAYERFKIGDGNQDVNALPFAVDAVVPAWARDAAKPAYDLGEVSDTTNYVRMTATERTNLASHTGSTSNPHDVTNAQVGLGNVTNDAQVKRSEMGEAGGVATLDSDGKVMRNQMPAATETTLGGIKLVLNGSELTILTE